MARAFGIFFEVKGKKFFRKKMYIKLYFFGF